MNQNNVSQNNAAINNETVNKYTEENTKRLEDTGYKVRCKDNYKEWLPPRIFYRGESKKYGETSNIAGVYRGKYQESSLYHDYMSRFPNKFKNMNNFSRLTYMQHFGLPTCLLDITSNFLVALFFTCSNNLDSNGRVWIILPKPGKSKTSLCYKIYNNYSDVIDILATLALLKVSSQRKIYKDVESFNNNKKYHDKLASFFSNYVYGNQSIKYSHKYSSMYKDYCKLMNTYEFRRLFHSISQSNNGFRHNIVTNNLFRPRIVKPAINNQRIKSQQGYFILESYRSNNKKRNSNIEEKENNIHNDLNKYFTFQHIDISKEDKLPILRELDINYGINTAKLFPDYEHVAKYVKEEFKYLQ